MTKIEMNDRLRAAATLMQNQQYHEALAAYESIVYEDPDNAAAAASQVGAAHFFLTQYELAIQWYEHAGRLGFDADMIADNIQEAREALQSRGPVYRHQEVAPPTDTVAHADDQRILGHIERIFGSAPSVFHELVSDRIHIDINMFPPNPKYPFHLLVTTGMSALPMNVPSDMEDSEQWKHAELCMLLPNGWKLGSDDFSDERNYWPVRLLKNLARIPHDFNSSLGWGHSIPNGDPATPYAPDTQLCGAVLIPPFLLGEDLFIIPGEPILHVFQVLPVLADEMDFKLHAGLDPLLEALEQAYPDDLYGPVNIHRTSGLVSP